MVQYMQYNAKYMVHVVCVHACMHLFMYLYVWKLHSNYNNKAHLMLQSFTLHIEMLLHNPGLYMKAESTYIVQLVN